MGFSKGTLHYMKKNEKAEKPFTLNDDFLERVNKWEALVRSKVKMFNLSYMTI